MKKITPTETFRNAIRRSPLPASILTSFREPYSVCLPREVTELLRQISPHVNVSRGLEIPIRKWAVKTAREINKNTAPVRGLLLPR